MTWQEWGETAKAALIDSERAERLVRDGAFRKATRADIERILGTFSLARRAAVTPVRARPMPAAWRVRGAVR
ncbi:MAG TPA: hypothetical protein VFM93_02795 [Candidatus Limnocylindria bacterium]|nr:hypothetical protein [Candidatus Limnocylindria bacterium]